MDATLILGSGVGLVVATDVGGLRTTVRDDVSGRLVPGHDPKQPAPVRSSTRREATLWD